jgi:catechol 2,3-dioxygenase-like lactoylglutathione lyase family enzyme
MKVAVKSLVCLIVFGGVLQIEFSPAVDAATAPSAPKLINTCLVTKNVSRLSDFYEKVLGIKPQKVANRYAEFHTGVGVLAIFSAEAQQEYIPGSAEASKNRSAILEFKVADVDQEYVRLQPIVATWVKKPTTQPWGTRSIYFRDPDGNLIDFYMPAPSR